MAPKSTGLGMGLEVNGVSVAGDVNSIGKIGGGPMPIEMTGIDKLGYERFGGLRDGALEWVSYFNPTLSHPLFAALPTADIIATVRYPGGTIGTVGAGVVAKQIGYDPKRGNDGSLLVDIKTMSNGSGVEFGLMATAGLRTDGAAGNGAGLDFGAVIGTTAFGLQMYVQLTAFTGTSVTVKLQHSNDDAAGDPYADISGATTVDLTTAPQAVRIATAGNVSVKRWVRVVSVGTFSNAVYTVLVCKNPVAVVF